MDRFLLIQKEIEGVKHTAKEHLKHVSTAFSQSHEALRAEVDAKIKQLGQNVHAHQEQIRREFLSTQEKTYFDVHKELSQMRQEIAQLKEENAQQKKAIEDLYLKSGLVNAKVEYIDKNVRDMEFSKYVVRHLDLLNK